MDSIRIIQLPTKSAAGTDDYIAVDSTANGTKKIQFPNLLDDGLTIQNKAADAKATGDAINGVNSAIGNEASTRQSADANLQTQIDQLIAPSGEAPSAAEIENARIGAPPENTVYPTLGDAIRGQFSDVKSAIKTIDNAVIKHSINLFDYNASVNGRLQYDGTISADANYDTSDYIDVADISAVTIARYVNNTVVALNSYYCLFDGSKSIIGQREIGSSNIDTSAAAFIRFSYASEYEEILMLFDASESPTTYIPYYAKFKYLAEIENSVQKDGIAEVTEQNTTFFSISDNRMNPSAITDGKKLNADGSLVDDSLYFTSDYCIIEGLTATNFYRYVNSVVVAVQLSYCFYDANKNAIGTSATANSATVPENAKYIRISYDSTKVNEIMVCPSTVTVASYIEYGYKFNYTSADDVLYISNGNSILNALKYSNAKHIIVNAGTYNIVNEYKAEYGADFWENYTGYSDNTDDFYKGLWIKDRILEMSPNAKIIFDYDGNNENVGINFSIFAVSKNAEIIGGYIKAVNMTGQNYSMLRYMVHDDFENWLEGSNVYRNIVFDGNVRSSAIIGGGCGIKNRYVVEDCVFLNNLRPYDISYHNNSSEGVNFIDVHGCYGNSVCAFRWFGTGTSITTCIAHDNHFNRIECVAHTTEPNENENMVLYAWNNEVNS